MISASITNKIERLESQVQALKHNPWQLEKEINNLLKALNAEPVSERDYLRERILTISATALLTVGVMRGFDSSPIGKFFSLQQSQVKTEQVHSGSVDSLEHGLAQGLVHALGDVESTTAKPQAKPQTKAEAKPQTKAEAKPQLNQGIEVERLMKAISTQESGGDHQVINSDSGASGKWQVMPANIPNWSKAALGRPLSHGEFMASPKLQHNIVKHHLSLYLKNETKPGRSEEEIIRRVASAWYSGQPRLWNNTRPQYSNGRQYPSIAEYTRSVWNLYQTIGATTTAGNFADTKAIIATWAERWQKDAVTDETIAGYLVSSGRGWRIHPITKIRQFHNGADLAAPLGTPLYAIADGNVVCTNDPNGGGIVVSFSSEQFPNLEFELLHLSKCTAKAKVKQGEIIGWIGSTGNSTGPHLHLQINSTITGNSLRVRSGWLYWFITGKKP
jgi:hypothetical protein